MSALFRFPLFIKDPNHESFSAHSTLTSTPEAWHCSTLDFSWQKICRCGGAWRWKKCGWTRNRPRPCVSSHVQWFVAFGVPIRHWSGSESQRGCWRSGLEGWDRLSATQLWALATIGVRPSMPWRRSSRVGRRMAKSPRLLNLNAWVRTLSAA